MPWRKHDYDDIPGTYVFNGENAATAYGLNKLLFSFNHEENRKAFADDPAGYADNYDLTDEQREALLAGDFLQILRLGANIYYMAKLAIPSGVSVQDAGAETQYLQEVACKQRLPLLCRQIKLVGVAGRIVSEGLAIRFVIEREQQLVQAVCGAGILAVEDIGAGYVVVVVFSPGHRSPPRSVVVFFVNSGAKYRDNWPL